MMSDDEKLEFTEKILDNIDLSQYLREYNDKPLFIIMDILGDKYDFTDVTNNDVCEGLLFNWMNEVEFEDYLYERYQKNFTTMISTTNFFHWHD